ncbi:hypothetical protein CAUPRSCDRAFT_10984 [Caulochytrium protostelioides]|uniref:Uncharacterized protein n=1 Tax=Caulochytrium protostelioides TaxID=1555241 RepID=A0A4V1ITK1_9FUNG|nr:hypothetical protein CAUPRSCDRAFT_10984 [Caulochytrium protostelioides]
MLRWCHASLVLALLTTSICPLATVSAAPSLLSIDQGSFKVDFAGSLPQQPNPFTDTAIYSSGSNGHPDSDSDAGDGGEHDEKVHDNLAELQSNPEDSWLLGLLPDQLQVGVKFEPSVLIYELLPLTSKLNYPPTTPSGRRTPNDPSNEQFDELYTVLQQIVDELTEGLNLGNNLLPLLPYPSTELSDNTGAKDPFILELQAVQKVYQQTARWAVAMYRRSSPTIMAPIPEYSALQSVSSWLEIEKWDLDMQLQSVPKDFWELLQTSPSVEKVFELPKIKRMPDPGGIAVRELDDLVVDLMDFVVNEYLDTRNNLQIAIVGFNQHFPGKMPSGSSKFAFLSAEMAYHREQLLAHVLNDRTSDS